MLSKLKAFFTTPTETNELADERKTDLDTASTGAEGETSSDGPSPSDNNQQVTIETVGEDGQPIAGLLVELTYMWPLTPDGQREHLKLPGQTDDSGRWTTTVPPIATGGNLAAMLAHPGYVRTHVFESLESFSETPKPLAALAEGGQPVHLRITLEAGRLIEGRVVTAAGQPCAGWTVATRGTVPKSWKPPIVATCGGTELRLNEPSEPGDAATERKDDYEQAGTDADGRFALRLPSRFKATVAYVGDVPIENSYRLAMVATADGLRAIEVDSNAALAELVSEIVVDDTAKLTLAAEPVEEHNETEHGAIGVTFHGRFSRTSETFKLEPQPGEKATISLPIIAGWPPLSLSVRAVASDVPFASAVQQVRLSGGDVKTVLPLREQTPLRVRAVEPDGTPIPGLAFFDAALFGYDGADHRPYPPPLHTKSPQQATDADGWWVWPDAAPGEWLFHVWDGRQHRHWVRVVGSPEEQVLELTPNES